VPKRRVCREKCSESTMYEEIQEVGRFWNEFRMTIIIKITNIYMESLLLNQDTTLIEPKKTRREIQDEIRKQKALVKAAKKASFRRKTEKKLAEKAERKVMHKVNNAKRKLEKKIEIKALRWKQPINFKK